MIPLGLFLLACAVVYIGTVQMAFTALMRLQLRVRAERHGAFEVLGQYLDDPVLLFMPARLLQAMAVGLVTVAMMMTIQPSGPAAFGMTLGAVVVFVAVCGHAIPVLIARRDPERVLDVLLPSFHGAVRILRPITSPLIRLLASSPRDRVDLPPPGEDAAGAEASQSGGTNGTMEIDEHEERRLLHSAVEFGDTLVREVMTPRPDIVAIKATATIDELRAVFMEEQYSRIPVFRENLDEVVGFVFVKDLVALLGTDAAKTTSLDHILRPAYAVPETKRVADLLKELQAKQVQSAIVHDEYGGTSGLVTIEDLLEELVGEIWDEYDTEAEPIVDEGSGSFVFAGTVGVDDVSERLGIEIERQGFETIAGYLLAQIGRVPRVGEALDIGDIRVEILEGERRRVRRIRVRRRDTEEPSESAS